MLRRYSWWNKPYEMPGIPPTSAACKSSTLPLYYCLSSWCTFLRKRLFIFTEMSHPSSFLSLLSPSVSCSCISQDDPPSHSFLVHNADFNLHTLHKIIFLYFPELCFILIFNLHALYFSGLLIFQKIMWLCHLFYPKVASKISFIYKFVLFKKNQWSSTDL